MAPESRTLSLNTGGVRRAERVVVWVVARGPLFEKVSDDCGTGGPLLDSNKTKALMQCCRKFGVEPSRCVRVRSLHVGLTNDSEIG